MRLRNRKTRVGGGGGERGKHRFQTASTRSSALRPLSGSPGSSSCCFERLLWRLWGCRPPKGAYGGGGRGKFPGTKQGERRAGRERLRLPLPLQSPAFPRGRRPPPGGGCGGGEREAQEPCGRARGTTWPAPPPAAAATHSVLGISSSMGAAPPQPPG